MGRKSSRKRRSSPPTRIVDAPKTAGTGSTLLADAGSWLGQKPALATALWYPAVVLVLWSCGYTIMSGSDLWWHLANGHWILDHHSIPLTDSWSYTHNGQPWLNEAWLSGLLFALWERAFGLESLAWWKWIVLVGTYVLLFHTVRRTAGSTAAAFVAVVFGAMTAAPFLDIRPQLYSFFGYALVLHLAFGRARPSPVLPLVLLLWANMHGVVIFGIVAVTVLLAVPLLRDLPAIRRQPQTAEASSEAARARKRSMLLWVACIGAMLINPLGFRLAIRPLDYALRSSSPFRTVGEWLPPFQPGGIQSWLYRYAILAFVAAIVIALVMKLWRRHRDVALTGLALGSLTLAMSLTSRRFVPLFAMSQALLVGPVLAALFERLGRRWRRRLPSLAVPAAALALGLALLWPYPLSSYAFQYMINEDSFPVELVNFVEANHISGNVFADYNWSGYLHYRTRGGLQVYVDGRADMVYNDKTYRRYIRVLRAHPNWIGIVESSGARYFIWPKVRLRHAQELLATGRWQLLYQDAVGVLLVSTRHPLPFPPKQTPDSPWKTLAQAVVAVEQGKFAAAEKSYRRALEQMPTLQMACYGLAEVEALQNRVDDALEQVRACNRIYPDPNKKKGFKEYAARLAAFGRGDSEPAPSQGFE